MTDRFFVSSPVSGPEIRLAGDQARHLVQVLRAAPGDVVTVFDGSGAEFTARLLRVAREIAELQVLARHEVDRELPHEFALGVALPKGDRQRWLIEKAVELGVTRLIPLQTTRGVAQPTDQALERCRRTVIEASKQCGRNRLMEIAAPQPVTAFLADTAREVRRLVAHPGPEARPLARVVAEVPPAPTVAAVGPEGGFTSAEIEAAREWQMVSLGPRILRIETAAIALAACVVVHFASGTIRRDATP